MPPRPSPGFCHVFLSCGEASGDRYGAALVAALRRRLPALRVSALGGPALAAAGAEIVAPAAPIAVMGFGEVAAALPAIWRTRRRLWRHLADAGVDLCVPVDFPGFNLPLARRARGCGVPVFYVVPPQLWAWGAWRLGGVRRAVDLAGTILPFEAPWFEARGVPVLPLGHPLAEDYPEAAVAAAAGEREARLTDAASALTLGLLPGSRRQEIARLLPPLLGAAAALRGRLGGRPLRVVVSAAPGTDRARLAAAVGAAAEVSAAPLPELLPRLDLALVCSGTASLEAALASVPHELVYRTSPLNYALARSLVRVRRVGLANLILGEDLVAERLQQEVAPAPLADALAAWAGCAERRRRFAAGAARLRARLGPPGCWERAAEAAVGLLARRGRLAGAAPEV